MKSRKSVELKERFNKRWLGYAAAVGTGILAATQPAQADIIYTAVNTPLSAGTSTATIFGGTTDFVITDIGFHSSLRVDGGLVYFTERGW